MESNVVELPTADKLWAWFELNRKPVTGGLAAALVVGLVVWFFVWRSEQREITASQALANVEAAQLGGGSESVAAEAYLKIAGDHRGTQAAARALLLAAGTYFTEGKYPQAQAQFERFAREYRGNMFLGQAVFGVATCLDSQGKTNEAVSAYKDIITRHANEAFVAQAQFALARLYEAQNKPELARDLYEQVERSDPFMGPEAGMRVEELKAKYPNLTPAAPGLTNAPVRIEKK